MKQTICVTGAKGQLGSEIRERAASTGHDFHFIDIEDADLTDNTQANEVFSRIRPGYIINCAAYTAVDRAESERDAAEKVNAGIPGNIAAYARENNTRILHISTDYVFSGYAHRPLTEQDVPAPESVYGITKLQGEEQLSGVTNAAIIRTSWLYSTYGKNFVKSMAGYLREREELKIVYDQVGSPTYAADLAAAILHIIGDAARETDLFSGGIYHYSNEGVASWYDLVMEIREYLGSRCRVVPIETKEYPLPAPRPWYSVMNKHKIKEQFGLEIPYWKESLRVCLDKLKSNESK
jgi:dTDP-4-dehydrorhamnose reductase